MSRSPHARTGPEVLSSPRDTAGAPERSCVAALPLASLLLHHLLAHHPATVAHALRVARHTALVAAALPHQPFGGREAEVYAAALLHDAGKLLVPVSILDAPRPLTEMEYAFMRDHPWYGVEMLRRHGPVAPLVEEATWGHHERWDGTGYPRRLIGAQTPLLARVVGLCDAYDAMRAGRPYRAAMTQAEARAEVERCAGTHFAPDLVAVVLHEGLLLDADADDA